LRIRFSGISDGQGDRPAGFELYGLTDDEIRIVEEATWGERPRSPWGVVRGRTTCEAKPQALRKKNQAIDFVVRQALWA